MNINERVIIAQEELKIGVDEEFNNLYSDFYDYLYKQALHNFNKKINKVRDFDDIKQAVDYAFYEAIKSFDINKNVKFVSFLYSVIKNWLTKDNKKHYKISSNEVYIDEDFDPLDEIDVVEDAVNKITASNIMNYIKENFSELKYNIYNMYYLQGYDYDYISRELNISKKQIDNALTYVKNKINKEDFM